MTFTEADHAKAVELYKTYKKHGTTAAVDGMDAVP
jgi:hypothetical protein